MLDRQPQQEVDETRPTAQGNLVLRFGLLDVRESLVARFEELLLKDLVWQLVSQDLEEELFPEAVELNSFRENERANKLKILAWILP